MSGPVVAIGFILLIPSVLGMLLGILMLFGIAASTSQISPTIEKEVRSQLVAQSVPEPIIVRSLPVKLSTTQSCRP